MLYKKRSAGHRVGVEYRSENSGFTLLFTLIQTNPVSCPSLVQRLKKIVQKDQFAQELSTVIDVIETIEIRDSLINNISNSTNSRNEM